MRMNPKRRRMAAQAKLLQSIVAEHGKAHDDSAKLQQGPTRSCLSGDFSRKGYTGQVRAPRFYDPTWSDDTHHAGLTRKPK